MNYEAVSDKVKQEIYVGVLLHEPATVGMAHNFSSSNDAINFHDEYWEIERQNNVEPFFTMTPEDRATAMNATSNTVTDSRSTILLHHGVRSPLDERHRLARQVRRSSEVLVWAHRRGLGPPRRPDNSLRGPREAATYDYHYSMYPKMFAFGSNR